MVNQGNDLSHVLSFLEYGYLYHKQLVINEYQNFMILTLILAFVNTGILKMQLYNQSIVR